jgi:hypothetical protein
MRDDIQTLADELDRLSGRLRQLEAVPGHWVDAFHEADVVGTETAACILNVSPATARRRAAESAETKQRVAIRVCGTWQFSVSRLLDEAEREGGVPAVLETLARVKKFAPAAFEVLEAQVKRRFGLDAGDGFDGGVGHVNAKAAT